MPTFYQIHRIAYGQWHVIDCRTARAVTGTMPKIDAILKRNELNNSPPPYWYQSRK